MRSDDSVYSSLQQVAGGLYTDMSYAKDIIDVYLLRKARSHGVRLPTGNPPDEYKFMGAKVFESRAGTSENVVYIDVGCFTDDHEVITPDGIKSITDFEVGDPVYTLDPNTFEVVEDEVAETHEYPNIYDEVHVSEHTTHNYAVTENHRFYTANNPQKKNEELNPSDYEWNEYRDISGERCVLPDANGVDTNEKEMFSLVENVENAWVTIYYDCDMRSLRGVYSDELREKMETTSNGGSQQREEDNPSKHRVSAQTFCEYREQIEAHADACYLKAARQSREVPLQYETSDWLELIGWYVTEGSSSVSNPDRIVIAQEQQNYREQIIELCEKMDLSYSVSAGQVHIFGIVGTWLEENCGIGSENKQLPTVALTQSKEYSELLLQTLVKGDGSDRNRNSRYYWTISEQLVDDVVELSLRVGETPRATERRDGEYRIQWGTDGSFHKENNEIENHSDTVHCITGKENHLIPVGRNKNFHWIGQSMYPSLIMSLNISPETLIGDKHALRESEYSESDCVWGYYDKRPVKHLDDDATYSNYTDGSYKMVYDPNSNSKKWSCDEGDGVEYSRLYFLDHQTERGFLTECVSELIALKNQYRGTPLYGSTKQVTNSIFGVLGWASENSSFRLFDWRLAEAITLTGRQMIMFSAEYVCDRLADRGYPDAHITAGDTDGCGIALPTADGQDDALSVVQDICDTLNTDGYDSFFSTECGVDPSDHHGEIEVESFAPKVFIPSRNPPHGDVGVKKRRIEYQTWDEGDDIDEISITGLEAERSDIAPLTRTAQELFAETFRMDNPKDELFTQLREWYDAVTEGTIALDRICKRGGIGQNLYEYGSTSRSPQPIYRGAKYATDHIDGVTVQQGDKPVVIYIDSIQSQSNEYPRTYEATTGEDGDIVDAVALNDVSRLPECFRVDWKRHRKKVLTEPLMPLLQTRFGEDVWEEITTGHTQTGFNQFAE